MKSAVSKAPALKSLSTTSTSLAVGFILSDAGPISDAYWSHSSFGSVLAGGVNPALFNTRRSLTDA